MIRSLAEQTFWPQSTRQPLLQHCDPHSRATEPHLATTGYHRLRRAILVNLPTSKRICHGRNAAGKRHVALRVNLSDNRDGMKADIWHTVLRSAPWCYDIRQRFRTGFSATERDGCRLADFFCTGTPSHRVLPASVVSLHGPFPQQTGCRRRRLAMRRFYTFSSFAITHSGDMEHDLATTGYC